MGCCNFVRSLLGSLGVVSIASQRCGVRYDPTDPLILWIPLAISPTSSSSDRLVIRRPEIYRTEGIAHSPPLLPNAARPIAPGVYRPIQYLGAKSRSLHAILEVAQQVVPPPASALDLFCGTSVVSQALARANYQVTANDVSGACAIMARAFLGIERVDDETIDEPLTATMGIAHEIRPPGLWNRWLHHERKALEMDDGAAVLAVSQDLPKLRDNTLSGQLAEHSRELQARVGRHWWSSWLMTSLFAGTYFGIQQAIDLDRVRVAIHEASDRRLISCWAKSVLLTSLFAAASACVFSAGKHFAQPYVIDGKADDPFLTRRALQDRSVRVIRTMSEAAHDIAHAASSSAAHAVLSAPVEQIFKDTRPTASCRLLYADPPYTAQQYSRFYHVLESLAQYTVPRLQTRNGRITRGIYPEGRFKSRFCSKTTAGEAFDELIGFAHRSRSSLLLSYSASNVSRNERIIALDEIIATCQELYGARNTRAIELDHSYRQFNRSQRAVSERDTPEVLVVAEC